MDLRRSRAPGTQRIPRAQFARPGAAETASQTTPNVPRSRLGTVLALVGAGLLMLGAGDALGRTGHQTPVVPLFLAGLTFIFGACAWRLTGAAASRNELLNKSRVIDAKVESVFRRRAGQVFELAAFRQRGRTAFQRTIHDAVLWGYTLGLHSVSVRAPTGAGTGAKPLTSSAFARSGCRHRLALPTQ